MARFWHNIPGNGLGSTGQREIAHGLGPDYILVPPVPPVPEERIEAPPFPVPKPQQGDVLLFQTTDDGDINILGGVVEMSAGLATSAYLSLFGGEEDAAPWWGNALETDPDRQFNSETQRLLDIIPATSSNLRLVEDAARRDLSWLSDAVAVSASIPAVGRLGLSIVVGTGDAGTALEFVEDWEGAGGSVAPYEPPASPVFVSTPVADVRLFQTTDDGEITVLNGVVGMSAGLDTSAYLSLFGGEESAPQWWGNTLETDPARQYVSATQALLDTIPATAENLIRIEDAVLRDLAWMVTGGTAAAVNVSTSIPAVGRVSISINIEVEGAVKSLDFVEIWEAA